MPYYRISYYYPMVYLDQKYRTLDSWGLLLKMLVLLEENKVPSDNILVPILKCNPQRVTKQHQPSGQIFHIVSNLLSCKISCMGI